MAIQVKRHKVRFEPNARRLITRFFVPGHSPIRARWIIDRVLSMSDEACRTVLDQTLRHFSHRHRNITKIFDLHFEAARDEILELGVDPESIPEERRLVIGAYFSREHAIESCGIFNPSIVQDPYQGGLSDGALRVIVSFRVMGTGHISSIAFRGGVLESNNDLVFEPAGELMDMPEIVKRHVYDKVTFCKKLNEMQIDENAVRHVIDHLGAKFIYGELQAAIEKTLKEKELSFHEKRAIRTANWLARSHYEISFSLDTTLSERVIFPVSYTERSGIEDARFVRFIDEDGKAVYYATYTAYDGEAILPKLMETDDFIQFKIVPLHGDYAQNKGMALFPRKINGQYAMLSRIDGINNYIMFSDQIDLWQNTKIIQEPLYPWEFVQIGNAGSPLETEKGWLIITHGVGPMRTYSLGASLLDLEDPTRVIARLREPLLVADDKEREGNVPNVVYSCGSLIHNGEIVLPYAMSDESSTYATIPLDTLLERLLPLKKRPKTERVSDYRASLLIVDDDEILLESLEESLEREGFRTRTASDGIDALMLIAKESFDLVLSDINMPNLDGFQLLKQMKQRGIDIPVIFMTGHEEKYFELRGKELGAVEYIKKPLEHQKLMKMFDTLLE